MQHLKQRKPDIWGNSGFALEDTFRSTKTESNSQTRKVYADILYYIIEIKIDELKSLKRGSKSITANGRGSDMKRKKDLYVQLIVDVKEMTRKAATQFI